ncbi:hypothetical protein ACFLIM_37150 [Nonomuraea sp. M3C6]|uniref:Hydrolase n=1 Tax=Nonomuraea marmarensis TaxID=3351344 RepID=A0ABW7ARD6_9ACTN
MIAAPDPTRPVRPGWVRVDCHLHTVASGDAVITLDQLAERVAASSARRTPTTRSATGWAPGVSPGCPARRSGDGSTI